MTNDEAPTLLEITLLKKSKELLLRFEGDISFSLSCEYLRVFSPSAEVRGHGGPGILQTKKKHVNITSIEPVGNYAVKLIFDDGHQSGLYTWNFLYDLGCHQDTYWKDYLSRLEEAHGTRE